VKSHLPITHDVIVVGAGPAGAAAAYDLAAAGKRVLLIDRRRFPRTKPCAGGLTIKTLRRLRYSIAPVIRQVCADLVVSKRLETTSTFRGGRPICAMTVREQFDQYCLQRTIERGAEFRVISHIDAIVEEPHIVTVHTTSGNLQASYVIGADGANSVVARLVAGFGNVERGFAIEAQLPTSTPPPMEFDFGAVEFGYGWLFPKRDHVNVGLYTNSPTVKPGRAALAEYARAKIGRADLQHVVGHHVGLRSRGERLATGRVALVGDAAGLVDPLLGEGIHNAIASGQAAAAAIAHAVTGEPLTSTYTRQLRPVLDDLRASHRAATRFYQDLEFGYRALTSPLVRFALMAGYARGMTFSEAKRWFFALPFLPARPARVLDEFQPAGSS
jgi:geranylgeranyl reductase family protein